MPKPCCEAVLNSLEKYCYSFEPKGNATKIDDPTHWDGGIWQPPASFDGLCDHYAPTECTASGQLACPRMLQLIARQFHPHICDAIQTCGGLCDTQCPLSSALFASVDTPAVATYAKPVQQQQQQQQQQPPPPVDVRGAPKLNAAQWQQEEAALEVQRIVSQATEKAVRVS